MNVHLPSFCLLFLSLQVRNCGSATALKNMYGAAGEDFKAHCGLYSSGSWKIFCRENCEGGNILIRTKQSKDQSGRYSTEFVREAGSVWFHFYVSISGLTQSDPGRYRCGVGKSLSSASYLDFRLVVVDALLDGNKDHHVYKEAGSSLTVACSFGSSGRTKSFCRGEPGEEEVLVQTDGDRGEGGRYSLEYDEQPSGGVLLVTITQLTQSDSGRYRCKLDRTVLPSLYRDFSINVTNAVFLSTSKPTAVKGFSSSDFTHLPSSDTKKGTPNPNPNVPLIVGGTLVIPVVLFSAALLVSCRRRSLRAAPKNSGVVARSTDENRGRSSASNLEKAGNVNYTNEDRIYQNLSSATRDQNQIYFIIDECK